MNAKQTKDLVWQEEAVSLDKPRSAYELSKYLKQVIVKSDLYTNIKGKNYVNVEGWQLAGMFTKIFPRVKSVERVASDTAETKYRAEVSLFDYETGKTVGFGVAYCSDKEYSKRNFDEYAIASMAQTRAVSKAYRLTLGWLMKLAGYEATPAEEMTADNAVEEERKTTAEKPWKESGKPSEKQLGMLAYLLKGLGKSQDEVDSIISQARTRSKEVVSEWIDDARKRSSASDMSPEEKMAAINHGLDAFSAAVVAPSMLHDQAEDIRDAQAEAETQAEADALERTAAQLEERMAGY